MSSNDLGMGRDISRRDFVQGATLAGIAAAWPALGATGPAAAPNDYPPARLGMRGSHPGSFEAAHALRDRRSIDVSAAQRTGESYDLIVVGGGLSGLAAAHFFIKSVGTGARVLILENHDDFGGHAKRNEMLYNGRLLALNGGTLEIESPGRYNRWARQVLDDIGVDLDRYTRSIEPIHRLYESRGLRPAQFFDRETFGSDRLVVAPPDSAKHHGFTAEQLRAMPISEAARRDLLRLQDPQQPDYMPGLSSDEKKARLARMSYRQYLLEVARIDPQAYWFYMALGRGVFSVGADALPALFAWQMLEGQGGFAGLRLQPSPDGLLADLPGGQHGRQKESGTEVHFPDGNATLARLLVRQLIPEAVPASTQEELGTAHIDYARLDQAANRTRIRLNSTVLNVRHDGAADSAREVAVTYSTAGRLYEVRGASCILASWHMMIPYLVPDLPAPQKQALADNVKTPLVYTNVFLKNWRAFERLGMSSVDCPTMYHDSVALAEPADLGGLRHARTPDEPVAIRMTRFPGSIGLPRKEQHRIGRAELLATSFETFERQIREQLTRVLKGGGFRAADDIIGIAVNRWPHGYSYTYNSLYDPLEWVFTESDQRPCVLARRRFGRISIANADAAASPHTDAAFLEAHRAVSEVLELRAYPFLSA